MTNDKPASTRAALLVAVVGALILSAIGIAGWLATGDPVFLGTLATLLGPPIVFFWNRRAEQRA